MKAETQRRFSATRRALLSGALLSGLAAVLLAVPGAARAAEYTWDMPDIFSAKSSDGVADQLFGKLVAEKTGGRIEIVHHFDGSLGYSGVDQLDAVRDGAVPLARQSMSYLSGYDPLFQLSSLPFLMKNKQDVETLYRIARPAFETLLLKYDQVLVSVGLFPPSGLWSRTPVTSIADLQNLKLRVFDINSLETFKRAGAAAINMGWTDVLPALSTKAIDGVLTSADLGFSSSIQDFLPAFTEVNWTIPLSVVAINKDVWDGLPDDLKQAVREAGDETTQKTIDRLVTQVQHNYEGMRAAGVTITEHIDPAFREKLVEAAQPTIEAWKEKVGPEGRKILAEYLAQASK